MVPETARTDMEGRNVLRDPADAAGFAGPAQVSSSDSWNSASGCSSVPVSR
jgi:hypothetical protein